MFFWKDVISFQKGPFSGDIMTFVHFWGVYVSPIISSWRGGVDFLWRLEAVNLCHLWAFPLGSMILTHWPRWLPRKRITTKTIKTSNLELAFFCKSLMIWKPQEGNFIAFLSLDSTFFSTLTRGGFESYSCHFGWLTGIFGKPKPKRSKGSNLPTSPSVTIKLGVETLSFGGVKNLKTDPVVFFWDGPMKAFQSFLLRHVKMVMTMTPSYLAGFQVKFSPKSWRFSMGSATTNTALAWKMRASCVLMLWSLW